MLRVLALLLGLACMSLVQASPSAVLTYDDARHLLARTGFGPTDSEVRGYSGLTRAEAVERLLAGARTTAITPLPASLADTAPVALPRRQDSTPEERRMFVREQVQEGLLLRGWWMQEMLVTPSPLTERMTLFWHNHFVSAQPKVRISRMMAVQNATLRANALGNFSTMLHAIAKDPAMVVYLDAAQNRRGAPNENFAREVMELFTLGEGRYTEQDIKEAARAYTGWSVDRARGTFVMRPMLHDGGVKNIFGKTGPFDGDDVLDLLLARPETASFIVSKLWREFVSPDPDAKEVARIAQRVRDSSYDIRVALGELLRSDAFFAPEHRGVLVKSPVELVIGTLRTLELRPADMVPFAVATAGMGQNLFSAPNVKGWPGGEVWINTTTLLARKHFLDRLARGNDSGAAVMASGVAGDVPMWNTMTPAPRQVIPANASIAEDTQRAQRFARQVQRGLSSIHFDSAQWMARLPGKDAAQRNASSARLLLATSPPQSLDGSADSLGFVRSVLLDPAYQVK